MTIFAHYDDEPYEQNGESLVIFGENGGLVYLGVTEADGGTYTPALLTMQEAAALARELMELAERVQ